MRLNITTGKEKHSESCTSIAVSLSGYVISGSDDFTVRRWNINGEALGIVKQFDSCVTLLTWVPTSGGLRRGRGDPKGKDTCLVACADGIVSFVNVASSRVESTIEAHVGNVTGLVYSPDGSSLITAGEDGTVKVWSQAGISRSTLANTGKRIYTLCWGYEKTELGGDCVLYTVGSDVIIKPFNPSIRKQIKWCAHSGVVLASDWSLMSGLIVTGGEDGVFKVWDPCGHAIYTSSIGKHPITSVKFSADGELFGVGSFKSLRVCDMSGWSHSYERISEGSAMSIQWTPEGTQLIVGCGTGAVCIAQLIDRKVTWGPYCATLVDSHKLTVQNIAEDTVEKLELRDKVIKLDIGYEHIIVCTTTYCACYPVKRLHASVQFDLGDSVVTLKLAPSLFLLADCNQGIQLHSYEGRMICALRLQTALKPENMASDLISLSNDTVAMRDPVDHTRLFFFSTANGKQLDEFMVTHQVDIVSVHLSLFGLAHDRKVAFVDRNRDLFLGLVQHKVSMQKISTMVSSVVWHEIHETLVAIADGHLTTFYCPCMYFSNLDLALNTKEVLDEGSDEFNRNDRIASFHSTRVQIRRGSDGALLTLSVSPYPIILFQFVEKSNWEGAMRLARFLNSELLWTVLTGLALSKGELSVAETGYGALRHLDKVRYLHSLKENPLPEARQMGLALFQHRPTEAERILLQAGLVYRCIDMNTQLFNWERALEIAKDRKSHIDTVMLRRQKYLEDTGKKETISAFTDLEGLITVDPSVVEERVKQELAKEAARTNAVPYK
ncbi:unnamed protein product [Phytomonas sp. Hart1]|nr:unnamed protein product [Phytomonas sp. Hart1]|eukprot:CCW71527.1 unnamed protein product [Phytomonas sp. isolate Hart1]